MARRIFNITVRRPFLRLAVREFRDKSAPEPIASIATKLSQARDVLFKSATIARMNACLSFAVRLTLRKRELNTRFCANFISMGTYLLSLNLKYGLSKKRFEWLSYPSRKLINSSADVDIFLKYPFQRLVQDTSLKGHFLGIEHPFT